MLQTITQISLGFFIGTYGSMVGAGGGFLYVPLLLVCYGMVPENAVGTSLFVVALGAISAGSRYWYKGAFDSKAAFGLGLASLPGSWLGTFVSSWVQGWQFQWLFALVLVAVAVYLFNPRLGPAKYFRDYSSRSIRWWIVGILGSFALSIFSSALGIGGGLFQVPLLSFLGLPSGHIVGTSQGVLFLTALVASIVHMGRENIVFPLAIHLGVGAVLGGQFGFYLNQRMPHLWIRRLLAFGLFIVAMKLLVLK